MKAPKASAPSVTWSRNRGGRPKSAEPMSRVTTWIPARTHDRLIQVANAQEQSVSKVLNVLILNVIQIHPTR